MENADQGAGFHLEPIERAGHNPVGEREDIGRGPIIEILTPQRGR